jgi:hypothetical protein
MLIKIKINKQTLECTTDDANVTVNNTSDNGIELEIEISKSELEVEYPWQQ